MMKKYYVFFSVLCITLNSITAQNIADLPLFDITQLTYEGAFRIDAEEQGASNINYSQGPIAYNYDNHSLFIVGHAHEQAIAEYPIPELIQSTILSELIMVDTPIQLFSEVLDRASGGNPQGIDRIGGLFYVNHNGQKKLIVNAYEYYDAPADNTETTLIINDADTIETSTINGFYTFNGGAGHTSGWISPVPEILQDTLGGSHITGQSSGIPIISRTSVGPSAFTFDMQNMLNVTDQISTTTLLDFSLTNPLHEDLSNDTGENTLWTHLSNANYGFIVPGTRTYFTIGYSGGHESGVCYKCTQDNGNLCGGYCTPKADDNYQFYWLWDLQDLQEVKAGTRMPYDVMPYDYGEFNTPFQAGGTKDIGGGSYDASTGNLYLSVLRGDTEQGTYSRPPVIVVYSVNGAALDNNNPIIDPEISMFPNPVSNNLTISGLIFNAQIDITDISGRQVLTIDTFEESNEINMSVLASGLYLVAVTNKANGKVYLEKIVRH